MKPTILPRPGILAAVFALALVVLLGSIAEARGGRGGGGFSRGGPAASGGFSRRPTPSPRPSTPS